MSNEMTPAQQRADYHQVPWRRRLPTSTGEGRIKRAHIILLTDGRRALLEHHRQSERWPGLRPDVTLRFSSYQFTNWEGDPLNHYGFGSFLPNESQVSADFIAPPIEGLLVLRTRRSDRRDKSVVLVGEILRTLTWIEERES